VIAAVLAVIAGSTFGIAQLGYAAALFALGAAIASRQSRY
jgi:hypothetical protein